MRSSRIWDSVIRSLYFFSSLLVGVGHGVAAADGLPLRNLDSRSQENRPNQTAASGRALRAPIGALLLAPLRLSISLRKYPIGEFPTGSLVRDGVFPSA